MDNLTQYQHILKVVSVKDTKRISDALHSDTVPMPGISLFGQVAKNAGYFAVACVNHKDFSICTYRSVDSISELKCLELNDGVYPCNLIGYRHNCTAYIIHRTWNGQKRPYGFIFDDNDEEAKNEAKRLILNYIWRQTND